MHPVADREMRHGRFLASADPEATWGWGTPAGRVRAERRAQLILKGAGITPDMRVLEIGCGTGMFTAMFAGAGAQIAAIDISPELLERAMDRHLPAEQVRFVQGRFEDYRPDRPFDAVLGSSILHHLDLQQALPRILDLLRPRGVLCFAEPNMLNPQIFVERKFRRFFPSVSPDETAFVRWTLAHRLQRAGFQEIEAVPFDWLHPAVPGPLVPFVANLSPILERIPLLCEFSGSLLIRAVRP